VTYANNWRSEAELAASWDSETLQAASAAPQQNQTTGQPPASRTQHLQPHTLSTPTLHLNTDLGIMLLGHWVFHLPPQNPSSWAPSETFLPAHETRHNPIVPVPPLDLLPVGVPPLASRVPQHSASDPSGRQQGPAAQQHCAAGCRTHRPSSHLGPPVCVCVGGGGAYTWTGKHDVKESLLRVSTRPSTTAALCSGLQDPPAKQPPRSTCQGT
jgi:hypothetical protein